MYAYKVTTYASTPTRGLADAITPRTRWIHEEKAFADEAEAKRYLCQLNLSEGISAALTREDGKEWICGDVWN